MNNRRNYTWLIVVLTILGTGMLILMTWGNYRYSVQNPGGNDFLVHYIGTRSLLVDGASPYSDETAVKIQTAAYGHPAQNGEHELRVAYPLYSIALFFPFAIIPNYELARALWMTALEVSLILLSVLSIRLAQWKISLPGMVIFLLFSVFWYNGIRPLINGNAVIIIALFIVGVLLCIRSKADEMAGVLLAFSTIKPQIVVLLVVFILIWALVNRRWRIILWFAGTLFLLVATASLLLPDWILQNLREVIRYPSYNPPGTPGSALSVYLPAMGERIGWAISAVLAIVLMIEWAVAMKAEFRGFLWAACLTLVASQWSGIQTDPGNFIVLLPVLALIFALIEGRWRRAGGLISLAGMLVLMVGLWLLFLRTLEHSYQPIQSPIMFFPLPAILFLGLYWVRWWAYHPPSVWFDQVFDQDHAWKK